MSITTKICVTCKKEMDVSNFNKNSSSPDGYRNTCKACRHTQTKAIRDANKDAHNERGRNNYNKMKAEKPFRLFAVNCITNHKANGFQVDITKDELEQLAKDSPVCAYCGETLEYSSGKRANPKAASLDRVDNGKVMTKDNVVMCCYDCNRMKAEKSVEALEAKMIKILMNRGYTVSK